MTSTAQDVMTLPQSVRSMLEMLQEINDNTGGFDEQSSWRIVNLTTSEYQQLERYMRRPGQIELYDCWTMIRRDMMSRMSVLFVRLPTHAQTLFVRAIQTVLTSMIQHLVRTDADGWFLDYIESRNGERDSTADTTVGENHPDLTFAFMPPQLRSAPHARKRVRVAMPNPTLIVEVCNDQKHADMASLASYYMRHGAGDTRTVVAVNTTSGTFSVWRYLRYLPTLVEGRAFRKCFQTQNQVPWRGEGAQDLALSVRDFISTALPEVEGVDKMEMAALMRKPLKLTAERLRHLWDRANEGADYTHLEHEESEGDTEMDLDDTEGDTEEDTEEDTDSEEEDDLADLEDLNVDEELLWEDTDEELSGDEIGEIMEQDYDY